MRHRRRRRNPSTAATALLIGGVAALAGTLVYLVARPSADGEPPPAPGPQPPLPSSPTTPALPPPSQPPVPPTLTFPRTATIRARTVVKDRANRRALATLQVGERVQVLSRDLGARASNTGSYRYEIETAVGRITGFAYLSAAELGA